MWITVVWLVVIVAFFYFFLIRPQKKQEKQVNSMRESLKIGDEISTNGGIIGRIIKIKDDIITLELGNDKTKIKIFKWAVRAVEVPADAEDEETEATKTEEK
ncbi:MAG: preprotein translocase subunit YajC [Clostridia bacterium]|nr:preprotein translocase subunit YajC [Clostridia bacterium]